MPNPVNSQNSSSPTTPLPAAENAPQSTEKKISKVPFQQRCFEQLDLSKDARNAEREAIKYKTAAVVGLVVFTLLALAAVAVPGLLMVLGVIPFSLTTLALAGVIVTLLLSPAYEMFENIKEKAISPHICAGRLIAIHNIHRSIIENPNGFSSKIEELAQTWAPNDTDQQFTPDVLIHSLQSVSSSPDSSPRHTPEQMGALLARYEYWQTESARLTQEFNATLDGPIKGPSLRKAIDELDQLQKFPIDKKTLKASEDLYTLRIQLADKNRDALIAKVNAAFVLSVLANPTFQHENESAVYQMHDIAYSNRMLDRDIYENDKWDDLVRFKQEGHDSLTRTFVKNASIRDIADKIFKATPMAA